jgi:hypothetical protein
MVQRLHLLETNGNKDHFQGVFRQLVKSMYTVYRL